MEINTPRVLPQEVQDIALLLLEHPRAWRMRAVERVELSSELWAEHDREIHVRPLGEVAHKHHTRRGHIPNLQTLMGRLQEDKKERISLILPITALPRVPILDLNITVAGKRVYRLPLWEGALLQAAFMRNLAENAGLGPLSEKLSMLLAAQFYYPSYAYESTLARYERLTRYPISWWRRTRKLCNKVDPMREYLSSQLGFVIYDSAYERWVHIKEEISRAVKDYEPEDYKSPTENPLIALPQFAREFARRCRQELKAGDVTDALVELQSLINGAQNVQESEQAEYSKRFLRAYAGFGLRWMMFARCRVPKDSPFVITVSEKRPIVFTRKRSKNPNRNPNMHLLVGKTAWKLITFRDAETNHVSIRVSDPAVRLAHWPEDEQVLADGCAPVEKIPDEEERTSELYVRHDASEARDERLWIKCHLRLSRLSSWMLSFTIGITLTALGLLWWRGIGEYRTSGAKQGLGAKDAAVILIPVAFAAATLLARESSTMGMRLRRVRQSILLGLLFALLGSAFILYFVHHVN
ncbi:hypothetical protein [Streptomyces rishiriensis]|uniref:hypothetical protein n=1 Tax=Streptomyces rishiriensis TaxID=68264 RepID=UPI00131F0B6B|nr:hypothetical protein [Streptomyces rishiriensis]